MVTGVTGVTGKEAKDWAAEHLRGNCSSLYTPFCGLDGDDIDYDALRTLVRHCLVDLDQDGIWLTGGIAEFWSLTTEELKWDDHGRLLTHSPDTYKIQVKDFIQLGASPRATIYLNLAARAHAFLRHRGFVTPEDVKAIAYDVLRHRVSLTYEAEAENLTPEKVIQKILEKIEVP